MSIKEYTYLYQHKVVKHADNMIDFINIVKIQCSSFELL